MAPRDVQKEAYHYLRCIVSLSSEKCLSSDEFLEVLKTLKNSTVRKDKELFSCLMRTLHNEWKFFNTYSYNILMKFANILGGTIEFDLISNCKNLNLTLQFVLDCLKRRPGTKMYNFGMVALNRFYDCLSDNKDFFITIAKIPYFNKFPSHIIECIEDYVGEPIQFSKLKNFEKSRRLYSPFHTRVEIMKSIIEEGDY